MEKNKSPLMMVRKKESTLIQMLLLFKFNVAANVLFIFFVIFPKFIPVLALTDNFSLSQEEKFKENYFLSRLYRKCSFFLFIKILNAKIFFLLSFVFAILNIIFIGFIVKYTIKIKKRKGNKIILGSYAKLYFYFVALFGQYLLEFYSFSFLFLFHNRFYKPDNDIYKEYYDSPFFALDENSGEALKVFIIIFSLLNGISFFLTELLIFYSLFILNVPFHTEKNSLNFTKQSNLIFIFTITNFQCLHYYQIFIKAHTQFSFIMIGIILFIFISHFFFNLYRYETNNIITKILYFLILYIILSSVLCCISVMKEYAYTKSRIFLIFLVKIISALFLLRYSSIYRENYLKKLTKLYLFQSYEPSKSKEFMEMFSFLVDKLITIKSQQRYPPEIIEIIVYHKGNCNKGGCRCKFIGNIPDNIFSSHNNFVNYLIKSIGFLFETTSITFPNTVKLEYSIILSDYYYHIKENLLFSFFNIQHSINLSRKLSWFKVINCYGVKYIFHKMSEQIFKSSKIAVKHSKVFDAVTFRLTLNKNIEYFCKVYSMIIDKKINFESNLKVNSDFEPNEVGYIKSDAMNRDNILDILEKLKRMSHSFKKINKTLKITPKIKTVEYYYIVCLFEVFFVGILPQNIKTELQSLNALPLKTQNFTQSLLIEKLDVYLKKYFTSDASSNRMILKFTDGIKIKYISANLCNTLNHKQLELVNGDFHKIFPKCLRESHSKAMMHYLFHETNYFYHRKTFIFNSNENIIPCEVYGAALPHLGKVFQLILNIKIRKTEKKILLLNSNLGGVSISQNVEEEFFFNLKLLDKCDYDLSSIFDIHMKQVKNYFEKSLKVVQEIQSELKLSIVDHYFSNLSFEIEDKIQKMHLAKDSIYINMKNAFINDVSLVKDEKKRQVLVFEKEKDTMILNVIKAFNRITESSLKEEQFSKLTKGISFLNHTVNYSEFIQNKNKLSTIKLPEKTPNAPGLMSDLNLITVDQKNPSKLISFKITLRLCYDTVFYLVKMKDLDALEKKKTNVKSKFFKHQSAQRSTDKERNKNEGETAFTKKEKNLLILSKTDFSFKEIKSQSLKRTKSKSKFLMYLIYLMILVIYVLGVIIVYTVVSRIDESQIILNYYFRILFHRDKLVFLQSNLLSLAFEFDNYTSMNLTDDEVLQSFYYQCYVQEAALIEFYNSMNKYSKTHANPISLLQNLTFFKIIKVWEPIEYKSDYISEIRYSLYLINLSVLSSDKEKMIKDIRNMFLYGLTANKDVNVYSYYGTVLYFFVKNFGGGAGEILENLGEHAINSLNHFSKGGTNFLLGSQSCWAGLNISFGIVLFALLLKSNRRIYQIIILMFVDNNYHKSKSSSISLRVLWNNPDNYYVKQKVKMFSNLLNNFNEDGWRNFNDLKKEAVKEDLNFLPSISSSTLHTEKINETQTNTTNSVSMTSAQINSTNTNLTNNSLIRSKVSNRLLIKKTKEKEGILQRKQKEATFSSSLLTKMLLNMKLPIVFPWILFLIGVYILFIIGLYVLMLTNTLYFKNFLSKSQTIFKGFSNYFLYLPNILNLYRISMIVGENISSDVINLVETAMNSEVELNKIVNIGYMEKYKTLKNFWNEMTTQFTSRNDKLSSLCHERDFCIDNVLKEGSYFSQGVDLGYKLMIQKYSEVANDYNNLKKTTSSIGKEELTKFLESKDFSTIQQNVEFVFMDINTSMYLTFFSDYESIKQDLKSKGYLIYFFGFLIEIALMIIFMVFINTYVKKIITLSLFGSTLFNYSFFRNVG